MKDFSEWNIQKGIIHHDNEHKWCNERDIWWCKLGINIGYEQDGKGEGSLRPVLIIKKFNKFVCLVVPLSTKKKKGIYYVEFSNRHLHSVKKEEKIKETDFMRIKKAITQLFV